MLKYLQKTVNESGEEIRKFRIYRKTLLIRSKEIQEWGYVISEIKVHGV